MSAFSLARELKKRGHNVFLFTDGGKFLISDFQKIGVNVIMGNPYPRKRCLREAWNTIREMRKIITRCNVEIIHSQMAWPVPFAYLAARSLRGRKVKIVWHCRGIHALNYPIAARLFNFTADFVIANCEFERKRLVRCGLARRKIRTIYNVPNILNLEISGRPNSEKDAKLRKELNLGENTRVVSSVARLAPARGVRYLLEAIPEIISEYKNVRFLVVGDGPLRLSLEQKVIDLGIQAHVSFLGFRTDTEKFYELADVVVNPTLVGSGTGNINAEAMFFGVPVVATKVGGVPEIITDGETGFLLPPKDPRAIAGKVLLLLKDEELRKKMGEAGRKRVEKFASLQRLGDEVEEVYEYLAG